MRLSRVIFIGAFVLAALLWALDALVDGLVFHRGPFFDLLLFDVPPHELWVRSLLAFVCIVLGGLLALTVRDRERDSEHLEHLNRVLTSVRDVNHLVTVENDRGVLLSKACETLTSARGYHTVWILLTDDEGSVEAVYNDGLGELRERFSERVEQSRPLPCLAEVARNGQRAVFDDVGEHSSDCPLVPAYRGRAAYVTAIEHGGERFGFMGVSLPSSLARDRREQALFIEVAGDLGLALSNISAIEQQKAVEAAQAAADLRYETLVETMGDGLAICDGDGVLTYVNDAYARIVASDPETLIGRRVLDMVAEDERPLMRARLRRRLSGGSPDTYECTYVTPDGEDVPVHISASALLDEDGNVIGGFAVVKDISEIKRREERLELLNRIVAKSPAVALVREVDPGWPVSFVSESIRQFGYAPEQFYSGELQFGDVVHPDDVDRLSEGVANNVTAGLNEYSQEYRILTANGDVRWVDDRTWVVRGDNGEVLCFQGVILDITERHSAQRALIGSEQRFRDLANMLPQVVFETDAGGRLTFVNQQSFTVFGYSETDLDSGLTCPDMIAEEDRERAVRGLGEVLAGGAKTSGEEYMARRKDGTTFPVLIYASPILDDGEAIGMRGILVDITDLKQAQQALAASEERYRELVQNANDIIYTLSPDGTITSINGAVEAILGFKPEELVGRNLEELLGAERHERAREHYERKFESGEPESTYEFDILNRRGEEVVLEINTTLRHRGGEPVEIVGIARDVTERKRAEEALERRTHALGERVKEMRCLHHVARLSEQHQRPLEEVLQSVADILPVSWRWPEISTAVVEFDGDIYEAGGAEGPPVASQTAAITVAGEVAGRIEVRYHEERPEQAEGPFVVEERGLIDTVAATVGDMIEHRRAQHERDTLARFPHENPMPVLRVGEDGVVDYANQSAAELLGQLGSGVGDLAPVDWRETLDGALSSGGMRRLEVASGERHFTVTAAPVPDLGYVNLYGMDVTERDAAEQALLESEQRFRRAIAQAPFPIMLHAEGGEVLTVNDVWTDITGYAPEELSTIEEWTERAYGERMTQVVEEIDHLHELDRAIDEGEYEVRTADGSTRIWHFHSAPLGPLPDGRRLVISMAADVTQRKAAQEALRESERRYRTVFENTGTATCLVEADGTISLANRGFAALAAASRDEIEGTLKYSDFVAEHEKERMATHHENRRRPDGEAPKRYEFDFVDRAGEMHRVFLHIDVIPGTKTAVASLVDVTELRNAQNELQALTDELEDRVRRRTAELQAANAELEAFAYSVSHDLRAPLRAIDGFSQAVVEDFGDCLDTTAKDYLGRVRAASQKMGSLIDDILQLSRITRAELTPDRVDLSALATEIVDDLREREPERDVVVSIEPDLTAEADGRLMEAALRNLFDNAWKFTGGTEEARITFASKEHEDGRDTYFVADNGAGFDMEYADKLFQPFQRLHREDEFPGTGIGLAIVRRVINRHGGDVWAEGEVGNGATFYFTLNDEN